VIYKRNPSAFFGRLLVQSCRLWMSIRLSYVECRPVAVSERQLWMLSAMDLDLW
jgi:hypothetical protein